jgi:large subunit ribosomal protein L6
VSRIGLMPIPVPSGIKVKIQENNITVEGSKGKLSRLIHADISVKLEGENLIVTRPSDGGTHRALHGLTRTLLANMVEGVTKGFERVLELSGVGYRAQKADGGISLQIGYCHPVNFAPPPGINIVVEGTNKILVSGIDKELVGQTAARIRALRPVDAYKGKGIKYAGERVRLKPGKAGKAAFKKQ